MSVTLLAPLLCIGPVEVCKTDSWTLVVQVKPHQKKRNQGTYPRLGITLSVTLLAPLLRIGPVEVCKTDSWTCSVSLEPVNQVEKTFLAHGSV